MSKVRLLIWIGNCFYDSTLVSKDKKSKFCFHSYLTDCIARGLLSNTIFSVFCRVLQAFRKVFLDNFSIKIVGLSLLQHLPLTYNFCRRLLSKTTSLITTSTGCFLQSHVEKKLSNYFPIIIFFWKVFLQGVPFQTFLRSRALSLSSPFSSFPVLFSS